MKQFPTRLQCMRQRTASGSDEPHVSRLADYARLYTVQHGFNSPGGVFVCSSMVFKHTRFMFVQMNAIRSVCTFRSIPDSASCEVLFTIHRLSLTIARTAMVFIPQALERIFTRPGGKSGWGDGEGDAFSNVGMPGGRRCGGISPR